MSQEEIQDSDPIGIIGIVSIVAGIAVFFILVGLHFNDDLSGGIGIITGVLIFLVCIIKFRTKFVTNDTD